MENLRRKSFPFLYCFYISFPPPEIAIPPNNYKFSRNRAGGRDEKNWIIDKLPAVLTLVFLICKTPTVALHQPFCNPVYTRLASFSLLLFSSVRFTFSFLYYSMSCLLSCSSWLSTSRKKNQRCRGENGSGSRTLFSMVAPMLQLNSLYSNGISCSW